MRDELASRRIAFVGLALVLAVFAVYGRAFDYDFVSFDDDVYVYDNPSVQSGLTLDSLSWAMTSPDKTNWHPLTWISHMLDVQLFGMNPGPHHAVSIALHALTALLLFLFLQWLTGGIWPSAVVAALFAFHPLRVESVVWISERKDVLSGLFWMTSLLAYARYTKKLSRGSYLLVALSMTAGLMAKPMVVTLPFVFLLLDIWPLRRWRDPMRPFLQDKLPLLGLSALACVLTILRQSGAAAVQTFEKVPFEARLIQAPISYVVYLVKSFWPVNLTFFYPHPAIVSGTNVPDSFAAAAMATVLLTAITVVVLRNTRSRPYLMVGWLWYLGTLVPVIGLIQVGDQAFADRYTYIPLIGIAIMVVWGVADLAQRIPAVRWLPWLVAPSLITALAIATFFQTAAWRDGSTLYSQAIRVTSQNYLAHNNLGYEWLRNGQFDRASEQFLEAIRINPRYTIARYNLGETDFARGDVAGAEEHYRAVLEQVPEFPHAHFNLGAALATQERYEEAAEAFRRAAETNPGDVQTHLNLGHVLMLTGDLRSAVTHFERVLEIAPDHETAHAELQSARERMLEASQ